VIPDEVVTFLPMDPELLPPKTEFQMILRTPRLTALALSALFLASPAMADENLFGYVYGAETLPAGGNEAYVWWTQRSGKGEGSYVARDLQLEFEHGWTDRFQTSFYLTASSYDWSGGAVEEHHEEDEPEEEDEEALDRGLRFNGSKVAFKWNLNSPYKDGYGLALYLEPGFSRYEKISGEREDEYELEGKVILQKNFRDDQIITSYNLTVAPEWEKESDGEWEKELEVEVTAGASYRFAPNWYAGLEARVHTEHPDFGAREHWALFAGPSLHYGGRTWWGTLTWLPQVKGAPVDADRSTRLHLDEHEKSEVRFKLGYNF